MELILCLFFVIIVNKVFVKFFFVFIIILIEINFSCLGYKISFILDLVNM